MSKRPSSRWSRFGVGLLLFGVATALRFLLDPVLQDAGFAIYFATVVIAGWLCGLGPSLLVVVLSLVVSAAFFGPPPEAPAEPLAKVLAGLALFFFVGITTSLLSESMRAAQRRAEAELEKSNQQRKQLYEADRHKDAFLAMLGHELRNPLAGIVGAVQVLEAVGEPKGEHVGMRTIIRRQADHMVRIIDDLLDVSRISRGKLRLRLQPVDLRALIQSTIDDFRLSRTEHREVYVDVPAESVWTMGDEARLTQVLFNLLQNADKFSAPRNSIWVTLTVAPGDHTAVLTVRDAGIGMSPEILRQIFEPFRQAEQGLDRNYGGLGLGLALVKGLVELHGGSIGATSKGPNQGAEFTIRLPITSRQAAQPSDEHIAVARTYRVLIIEDRRDAALPLKTLLSKLGHDVELAIDGPSGLQAARRQLPEVVLCDVGLPGMNGYEVAAALRADAVTQMAYLVAITGYGRDEDRQRALAAGFDQHLTKPVSLAQLQAVLACIDRRDQRAVDTVQAP
jgi:signal transduction histidine kinase/ActR/RegA family two-component response regulator